MTAQQTFEHGAKASGLPTIDLPSAELDAGITVFGLFCRTGLSDSNGEARRLIRGGGARLNDNIISDETLIVSATDADPNGLIKLSAGKKRHVLIRIIV